MSRVQVVAGVILSERGLRRILLGQRAPDREFPFAWACPGGKVEPGESPHDALVRELREELGVLAKVAPDPVAEGVFDTPVVRKAFRIVHYTAEVGDQQPKARDGLVGVGWFSAAELARTSLTPGCYAARVELLRLLDPDPKTTALLVQVLRARTQAGTDACRLALWEAAGDVDAAERAILRSGRER